MGALLTQPGSRTTRSPSRSSCTATSGQRKSSDAFLGSFKRYASIEDNALLFFSLHDQISPSRQIVGVMFNGMMLGFQMLLRDQPTIINPLKQFCSIKSSSSGVSTVLGGARRSCSGATSRATSSPGTSPTTRPAVITLIMVMASMMIVMVVMM